MGPSSFISIFFAGAGLLIFAGNLGLAAVIFFKSRRSKANILFVLFFFSVAVYGLGFMLQAIAGDVSEEMLAIRTIFLGTIFIPIFFTHAVYATLNKKIPPGIIFLIYLCGFGFEYLNIFTEVFAADPVPKFGLKYVFQAGPLYPLLAVFFGAGVAVALYQLFSGYKKASGLERYKLRYLFWGMLVGFGGGSFGFLLGYDINLYPINPLTAYAVFWGNVLVAYGIVRYRLMDIRVVITRAGIIVGIYAFILGIPFWIGYSLLGLGWGLWLIPVGITVAVATVGPIAYRYIQSRAESILLAQQRHYQRLLVQAGKGMMREHDLARLLKLIVYIVKKIVRINFAAIFMEDKEGSAYKLEFTRGVKFPVGALEFSSGHTLLMYLKERKTPFTYEELPPNIQKSFDIHAKVGLVVPAFVDNHLLGFLFLGEKVNKGAYSQDDINTFDILARQAALAAEYCVFLNETKKAQERLFAAEKLASIGGMASGVAHQIKNRLNHFSVAAGEIVLEIEAMVKKHPEVLENAEVKETIDYVKKVGNSILDNVKRTDEIIRGILNYSYAQTDEKSMYFSTFSFGEVVHLSLGPLSVKHGITDFPLTLDFGENDFVYGVRAQIMEVVLNLLDNAYEAIEEKIRYRLDDSARLDFKPLISLRLTQEKDHSLVVITDNGVGMKDEDKNKVFAPFFTTKPSSKKSGIGVGMYIIKRMIEENHKGKLWFESKYMEGSRFYVKLPHSK